MKREAIDILEWNPKNLIETGSIRPENIAGGALFTTPNYVTTSDKIRLLQRGQHPYVCNNQTEVMPDPKKIYGYFKKDIIVQSMF